MTNVIQQTAQKSAPHPRVPLPAAIDVVGQQRTVQVNHCRMPNCDNFGLPARHQHGKRGPSKDRDMHYKVHSTAKGTVPSVRCKSCHDNPPIKSNEAIAAEVRRMVDLGGLHTCEETVACRNSCCGNSERPIAYHRSDYQKVGTLPNGGQYYRCKNCGRQMLVSEPVRLHKTYRTLAADVFGRIVNNIEADAQVYQLNWVSRLDRRNVELSAYCCVDSESRFIFGLHSNFDPTVDPFEINAKAARQGDLQIAEAFREYPQYWLAGDELHAGRAMSRSVIKRKDLIRQLELLYAQAASRADVENIELHHLNTSYVTPELKGGLQVHMPYTTYGHWLLMHRILTGAGVRKVQANVDIDSTSRAAFICAFVDEIKGGDAHLFYVRFNKYLTVDQRKRLLAASRRKRRAFAKTLPEEIRRDSKEVARRMMMEAFRHSHKHGKWGDEWVDHPLPTMNEPEKAVSWMTPDETLGERQKADLFLRAGIARVDNVFQRTRRLINALERPIGTSSGYNTVWHGYAPYNPEMVQIYLTVFRAVHNFVWASELDGMTPAMRLGFAKKPLVLEDILWPGQPIPRPKRSPAQGNGADDLIPLIIVKGTQGRYCPEFFFSRVSIAIHPRVWLFLLCNAESSV